MSRTMWAGVGAVAITLAVGGLLYRGMQPRDPAKVLKRFDYKIHTFSSQWQAVHRDATGDGLCFDVTYLRDRTPYHVSVLYSRPQSFRVTVKDESESDPSSAGWTLRNTDDREIEYHGHDGYEKLFLTCLSKVAVNSLRYAIGH